MAGSTVGALRITLGANTANFEAGMKRAKREAANSATAIQRSLGSIKGAFGGLGTAIVGGATIAGLVALTKRGLEYASSLGEVAQQVGVTTRDLQVFRAVGGQVGISTQEMDKGLQKFTKSLGDARNGSQDAIKVFKAVGFNNEDIKRLDVHDALMKTADGLKAVGDRASRGSAEVKLFGKAGQQMDTFLTLGARGINDLAASFEKLGYVLSDEQIKNADETADKLRMLKEVLEARIAGAVADNAQSILALANSLTNLAAGLARFWGQNPQRAMGVIGAIGGALVGLRLGGGLPGALIGAGVGGILGHDLTPDSLANLRNTARSQITQAQSVARARGYYAPGTTAAQKKLIMQDPLVTAHLDAARKALSDIRAAQAGSIAAPAVTPTGGTLSPFLAGPGKKGPKGPSAEELEKERLRTAHEFFQKEIQGEQDLAQAREGVTHNVEERAKLQLEEIDLEQKAKDEDIDFNLAMTLADKTISASQKQQAIISAQKEHEQNAQVTALHKQAVTEELAAQKREDALNKLETSLDIQKDMLQLEDGLAETAKQRRDIELRLLDIAERQERARLEAVIADEKSSEAAKEEARQRLAALSAQHDLKVQGVLAQTRGPLEQFQAELPTTADKMNEALQNVAVHGLQSLEDGILGVIDGTKSLAGAFREMASQIIAELLRIQLQKMIIAPLANALGGILGGGIRPGVVQSLSGDASALIAANPGVFASGGLIRGPGTSTSDSIPIMASDGEYIMTAGAVRRIGVPQLDALNNGATGTTSRGGGLGGSIGQMQPGSVKGPSGFLSGLLAIATIVGSSIRPGGGAGAGRSSFTGLGASLGGETLTGGIAAASPASLVPKLPLLAGGGYTGDMGTGQIAGLVHGREYVFDAAAVRRIGPSKLEAIRRGTMRPANDHRGDTFAPVININARMSEREARETATQAASAFQARVARSKQRGY